MHMQPPVNRLQIEDLSYAVRDVAAVVGLIEIAAAGGDQAMKNFACGIERTAALAAKRLEEISSSLMVLADGEVRP